MFFQICAGFDALPSIRSSVEDTSTVLDKLPNPPIACFSVVPIER
jgi:hypothetical protein